MESREWSREMLGKRVTASLRLCTQEKYIENGGKHGEDRVPKVIPRLGERKQIKCLPLPPVWSLLRIGSNKSGLEGTIPE